MTNTGSVSRYALIRKGWNLPLPIFLLAIPTPAQGHLFFHGVWFMFCPAEPVRVRWSASVACSTSSRFEIVTDDDTPQACDLLVVEFSSEKDALPIHHTLSTQPGPVLLLASQECMGDACGLAREEDDICLIGSPWQLIEHRLMRLYRTAMAGRDALTALRSRKELIRYLGECCAEANSHRPVSVILLDMDHFKALNDKHGHAIGDSLLVECGQILNDYTSQDLFVARFGGEEFVLVSRLDEKSTRQTAEQIRLSVASHQFCNSIRMSTSIGITTTESPGDVSDLLRQADEALYAAKAGGRNLVYSYNQLKAESSSAGEDVDLASLENRARVFSERVTSFITQRSRTIIEGLKHDASTDALTQMYNRRYLDHQLAVEVTAAQREESLLCVALLDVDHFGQINKRHGWPTGDAVLRQVAGLIQSNIRGTDWVGRYGGEEFCIVLTNTSLEQARIVLERLRRTVEGEIFESTTGTELTVTVSIGAVECSGIGTTPLQLLEQASTQAFAAKSAGRNCLRS